MIEKRALRPLPSAGLSPCRIRSSQRIAKVAGRNRRSRLKRTAPIGKAARSFMAQPGITVVACNGCRRFLEELLAFKDRKKLCRFSNLFQPEQS
jgi:hypothetical protein